MRIRITGRSRPDDDRDSPRNKHDEYTRAVKSLSTLPLIFILRLSRLLSRRHVSRKSTCPASRFTYAIKRKRRATRNTYALSYLPTCWTYMK